MSHTHHRAFQHDVLLAACRVYLELVTLLGPTSLLQPAGVVVRTHNERNGSRPDIQVLTWVITALEFAFTLYLASAFLE